MQQIVVIPEWVRAMIEAPFSIIKGKGKHEDDLKYFCVDCCGHPLTKSQMKAKHDCHKVLRAYTCSHRYVYRVHDIYSLRSRGLDVSGVAPFLINSGLVFCRKSPKALEEYQNSYGVDGLCFTCGRGLTHAGFFCSILCKFLFSPPPHHSNESIRMSVSILEQNQVFAASTSRCKKKKHKGSKKKPIRKDNSKEEINEEKEIGDKSSLKRKHGGVGDCDGINKTCTDEENQGSGGLVTDCKKKVKPNTIKDQEGEMIKVEETSNKKQKRLRAQRKRKRRAGDGIKRTRTTEAFIEDNRVAADSFSEQSKKEKKTRDSKEGQIKLEERCSLKVKFKLGAGAGAGTSDKDGGMKKTETTNNEKKLLKTLISVVITDSEKLSPTKRRPRKGTPCRSPFF